VYLLLWRMIIMIILIVDSLQSVRKAKIVSYVYSRCFLVITSRLSALVTQSAAATDALLTQLAGQRMFAPRTFGLWSTDVWGGVYSVCSQPRAVEVAFRKPIGLGFLKTCKSSNFRFLGFCFRNNDSFLNHIIT